MWWLKYDIGKGRVECVLKQNILFSSNVGFHFLKEIFFLMSLMIYKGYVRHENHPEWCQVSHP